jgi:deazaflavin-dependent oxidoreductase (nitroreductase family)
MPGVNDFNAPIIDEFRSNEGRVGGPFEGLPILLLHHKGAKTGIERCNPLAYQRLGEGSWAVFASKGGAPTNPDWYHNLLANPEAMVEIGSKNYKVKAREALGEERERIWSKQKIDRPGFADYEQKTKGKRDIPVVILEKASLPARVQP